MFGGYHFDLDHGDASRGDRPHRLLVLASKLAVSAAWLARWCAGRSRQRRVLGELDERLLADIGVSRKAASTEAAKWFWQ